MKVLILTAWLKPSELLAELLLVAPEVLPEADGVLI